MGKYGVKGALLGKCDDGLVVGIDVCVGVAIGTGFPVIGVVSPHDVAKTKGLGDRTDTVVNVPIGRLSEKVRKRIQLKRTRRTRQQVGVTPTTSLIICIYIVRISNQRPKRGARIQLKRHEHGA